MISNRYKLASILGCINHLRILVAVMAPLLSSSSIADILDSVPEASSLSEGLVLIQKDSFGEIELAWLIKQRGSIDTTERTFGAEMGNGYHGISLMEPFGRIRLSYGIFIGSKTPDPDLVFDVSEEEIVSHFSNLKVGDWNEWYKSAFEKYKWNWISGEFKCEAIYEFWEPAEPSLTYECSSLSTE